MSQIKGDWAFNKVKLSQAIAFVTKFGGGAVTEEAVKENYIARAGLLVADAEIDRVIPRVSANKGIKVSTKGENKQ